VCKKTDVKFSTVCQKNVRNHRPQGWGVGFFLTRTVYVGVGLLSTDIQ